MWVSLLLDNKVFVHIDGLEDEDLVFLQPLFVLELHPKSHRPKTLVSLKVIHAYTKYVAKLNENYEMTSN